MTSDDLEDSIRALKEGLRESRIIPEDVPDLRDPREVRRTQYLLALLTIADFLHEIGEEAWAFEIAMLSGALKDLNNGTTQDWLRVGEGERKKGRPKDREKWLIKTWIVLAVEEMVLAHMSVAEAAEKIDRKWNKQFGQLFGRESRLRTAIPEWVQLFRSGGVTNGLASLHYGNQLSLLKERADSLTRADLKASAETRLTKAARRAAVLKSGILSE